MADLRRISTHFAWRFALLAACTLATVGCAHHRTTTSRQLETNESVTSAGFDVPGMLVLPRFSFQYVEGFGWGDLSFNAGTAGVTFGGGLGTRYYLSDLVHLDTGVLYRFVPPASDYAAGSSFAYPRFGFATSTHSDRVFYGGASLHGYVPLPAENAGVVQTLRGGVEVEVGRRSTLQFELTLPVVGWFRNNGVAATFPLGGLNPSGPNNVFYANGAQLSIGLNWFQ